MNISLFTPKLKEESKCEQTPDTFEKLLISMKKYGRPRVSCLKDGEWCASVDMHVAEQGASFEVKSDFSCKTPMEALTQCHDRIIKTLERYK